MSQPVEFSVREQIALVRLDRPGQANALDAATLAALSEVERRVAADRSVRAVVITGAGRQFCAGIDLAEALQRSPWQPGVRIGFDLVPQPVIAAVNGAAMGGGLELALACDFRIVASTAMLGLPEVQFGELPLGGATARLARIVGPARAKRMILTGEPIDAATALAWGLADEVVPADETLDVAMGLARRMCSHAPYAVQLGKLLVDRSVDADLATALELERRLVPLMATEGERAEARRAAAERSPLYRRLLQMPAATRSGGDGGAAEGSVLGYGDGS